MKVSVVIPAYNEEKYIEATLRSVFLQDYSDFEVIVVNNNSTDKTAEIVSRFPTVKLLSEKRAGVQFARECGRLQTTGEIIVNLDADCQPEKNWLSNGVAYFKNEKIVCVSGPYDYYDASPFFRIVSLQFQKTIYNTLSTIFYFLFRKGVIIVAGNVFIRASALAAIGGYNTSIAFYGDDTDTANRLVKLGKVLYKNNIMIKSSARRFGRQGVFTVFTKYVINYLWVIAFGKPYHLKAD